MPLACSLCGGIIKSVKGGRKEPLGYSIDHIVPYSQGGSHDVSNLRLVHYVCNMRRKDSTDKEFLDKYSKNVPSYKGHKFLTWPSKVSKHIVNSSVRPLMLAKKGKWKK